MKNLLALISIIVFVFLFAAIQSSCRGTRRVPALPDGGAGVPARHPPPAIEDYKPPADIDPGVFEMLRDEFLKELGTNPERTSASAPMGDAGRVTDLAYDPATGMLTWTYVNLGDYNLSGDVSIADVAEVARYYLADATDGEGDDAYESWVDGSGDGEVNIADVAPLAQNYLNEVSEYVILTSQTAEGEYTEIARVDFSEAKTPSTAESRRGVRRHARLWGDSEEGGETPPVPPFDMNIAPPLHIKKTPSQTGVNFPKIFEVALPEGALQYIAVEPVDSLGNPGERSNAVGIPVDGPPVIVNVQPTHVEVGIPVMISAVITGAPVTAYFWDFGGGADPGTSTEPEPLVTPIIPGTYSCSLQAFNEFGNESYDFMLYVEEPPEILSVDPPWAAPNAPETFSATVNGTPPFTYEWDFGGGATPNASSEPSPNVMVGDGGVYNAQVTVANKYGSDTFSFNLQVGVPDPWPGAVYDSIFLLAKWLGSMPLDLDGNPATPAVDTDVLQLHIYGWTAAGKPLAALDTVRISMLKTDAVFFGSSPGGYFLDNAYAGDLVSTIPPQPDTFFELGVTYGRNDFEIDDYRGVLSNVLLIPPGGAATFTSGATIAFDIIGDDGSKFGRTYYTDLSVPPGEPSEVTDLAFDQATELLTWSYVNLGDYSLDGDVSIADVAPVAQYYLANATDGIGDDAYEAWEDGSGDLDITIADVAPVAKYYLNGVSEYVILTGESAEGEYTEIGRVDFADGSIFPVRFEVPLPEGALAYIAVKPSGITGTLSNVVYILSETPPLPPIGLEASDGISRMITLTWTKSEGAHGYKIYRDSQDAPVVTVGDVDTWDDTSVGDFEVHTYWLKATNAAGMSDFSESDTGYVGELQPQPVMTNKHHFATLGKDYGAGVTSAYEFTIP